MVSITLLIVLIIGIGIVIFMLKGLSATLTRLREHMEGLPTEQQKIVTYVREEIALNRDEFAKNAQASREEAAKNLNVLSSALLERMAEGATLSKNQLDIFSRQLTSLTQVNEEKLENMRRVVEEKLQSLQVDNSQKLDKMREVVDEKLHATLERRLGDSFKMVSERLEKVHQGLGEMQILASGVGDLKKVLSNVKTRGILGEVQLENLLEQILSPDQYAKNVVTKSGTKDPVEFVIKLPGSDNHGVLLPIDAKFPLEDYERLQNAEEAVSPVLIEEARKALEARIKQQAKTIREKYLEPPLTTDFAIMFLPTEGLYAEVLRRPGLFEMLRRDYSVTIAGPTTIAAILSSFQLGFRTLAVQKRASEVWSLLGMVKTEFGKFGDILERTHKKLQEAGNTIDEAAKKSRTIERKLRDVQELPVSAPPDLIEHQG